MRWYVFIKNSIPDINNYSLKSDIPTVANEYVFRIDFDNLEDPDNIQTSLENFTNWLFKGFTLKANRVSDNTSIDGKYVPDMDYEIDIYYDQIFAYWALTYYINHSDNSDMKIIIMNKGYDQSENIVTFNSRLYGEKINITELYIEENTKFDSNDVYC